SFTLLVNNAAAIVNLAGATWDFQGDGRIVPNNGPVGLFTNQGTLKKSAGTGTANISITHSNAGLVQVSSGILSFSGSFANFSNGTLSGGIYVVHTTLQFTNANIQTNGASVVLDGPNAVIVDQSGGNGLAHLATNAVAATFSIQNGANLITAASFE